MRDLHLSFFDNADVGNPGGAIECAKEFSREIIERVDAITAVAGGGSFFKPQASLDSNSDLDLYCFSKVQPQEIYGDLSGLFPTVPINNRSGLLSTNLMAKNLVVDIKVFSLDDYASLLQVKPNLDPQYLENLENLHNLRALSDPMGNLRALISSALDRREHTIEELKLQLHEVYAKSCYWAVIQGVRRDLVDTGNYLFNQACEALIQLIYLDSGVLPPSVKWRTVHKLVDNAPLRAVVELMFSSNLSLVERLIKLKEVEQSVSESSSKAPWCEFESKWWWLEEVSSSSQ